MSERTITPADRCEAVCRLLDENVILADRWERLAIDEHGHERKLTPAAAAEIETIRQQINANDAEIAKLEGRASV